MEDPRWKEFEMRVEASRYYLNVALQTNIFFYAITGVVLGFYLNKATNEYLVFALLLPILIATILGSVFVYAAELQLDAAIIIEEIRGELNKEKSKSKRIKIKKIPDLNLLYILLWIFGRVFFLVGIALIVTPFLNVAPFPWGSLPPLYLIIFLGLGSVVLLVGGRWTLSFARTYGRAMVEQRGSPQKIERSGRP
jgi:hypothetical protein